MKRRFHDIRYKLLFAVVLCVGVLGPASAAHGIPQLGISVKPSTVPVGSNSYVAATTSFDIGPTPYWTEVFDASTGTLVAGCGRGTICGATVKQSVATTHTYTAYLSAEGIFPPPPSMIHEVSWTSYVTWSNLGWQVTLRAPAEASVETVTATTNRDVKPTPYSIDIYTESASWYPGWSYQGKLLRSCVSGTSCSVDFTPPESPGVALVALVESRFGPVPPPRYADLSGIVASSAVVYTVKPY